MTPSSWVVQTVPYGPRGRGTVRAARGTDACGQCPRAASEALPAARTKVTPPPTARQGSPRPVPRASHVILLRQPRQEPCEEVPTLSPFYGLSNGGQSVREARGRGALAGRGSLLLSH